MAWVAKLDNNPSVPLSNNNVVQASVSYFDSADTGFVTPLAQHLFLFDPGQTAAQMKQAIITWGQQARATQAVAAQLVAIAPAGTAISVP